MRIAPTVMLSCLLAACGSSAASTARTTVSPPASTAAPVPTTDVATTTAPPTTPVTTPPPTATTPPTTTASTATTPPPSTTPAPPTFDLFGAPWLRGDGPLVQAGSTLLRAQRHTEGETYDIDWVDAAVPSLGTVSSIVNDDPHFAAFENPQGGAVVVVTSTTLTPANGLTPEQTTLGITAWSTTTNKLLWQQPDVPSTTAVPCGQMLLVSVKAADTYDLSALDPVTGTEIAHVPGWGYQLDKSICYQHSIALDDGWTNLDTGAKGPAVQLWGPDGKFALTDKGVFDMSTGSVIFESHDVKKVDGALGLAVLFNYDLAVVDLANGSELWRIPGSTLDAVNFDVVAVRNGVIFGTTGDTLGTDAKLVTLDVRTGAQLWAGGRWGTFDGSDSRIFLDSHQIGSTTAVDLGPDTGVSFVAKAPLLGVDGGTPIFG